MFYFTRQYYSRLRPFRSPALSLSALAFLSGFQKKSLQIKSPEPD